MIESVTDVDSFKRFIRDRAQETWSERGIPYYLSFVAIELKRMGVDYRSYTGALKLSQWALTNEFPDTKIVAHPSQKAKIGFVPATVDFQFTNNEEPARRATLTVPTHRRGRALLQFVEALNNLPDEAVGDFQVPAKTLIALLKN